MENKMKVYNVATVFVRLARLRVQLRKPYIRLDERKNLLKQAVDCCEAALLWIAGQRGQCLEDIRTLEEWRATFVWQMADISRKKVQDVPQFLPDCAVQRCLQGSADIRVYFFGNDNQEG